jgi:hypothetical protein
VHVCRRQQGSQWQPPAVYDQVVLAARLPSVCGIRTCLGPPFLARTLLESNAVRLHSMSPCWPSSLSNSRCSFSNTPARPHWRSLRQHVAPLHPNTSAGRSRQAIPVLSTKMMPRRHARSSRGGRPLPLRCRCRGRSGATRSHSSSGTSSRFIPRENTHQRRSWHPPTSEVHF